MVETNHHGRTPATGQVPTLIRRGTHVRPAIHRLPLHLVARLILCLPLTGCGGWEPTGREQLQAPRETWEAHFLSTPGSAAPQQAGYRHTVDRVPAGKLARLPEAADLRRVETDDVLRMMRFGQPIEIRIQAWNTETTEGHVQEFGFEINLGGSRQSLRGHVDGGTARLQWTGGGQTQTVDCPWPTGCGGLLAVEDSLRRSPMAAGESRTILALQPVPLMGDLASADLTSLVELRAIADEAVTLPGGPQQLMRIHSIARIGGATVPVEADLWHDSGGEILKSSVRAFSQESYRVTQDVALAGLTGQRDMPAVDVGLDFLVPLANPSPRLEKAGRARYRIVTDGIDASRAVASSAAQQVFVRSKNELEVVVERVEPDADPPVGPGNQASSAESPPAEALAPGRLVESDDALIVDWARQAAAEERDPWRTALALERLVHERIEPADFQQVFSSARETAESGQGDCTEHAVLLVALLRARGIPARGAMGMIFVPDRRGFLYHMWTEAWIGGRWIPLDATRGRGGTGVSHLKLSDSLLSGSSLYDGLLPLVELIGRLKIELIDVQ